MHSITSQGMVQAVAVSCAPDCKALCAVVNPGNLKSAAACRIPASIVVKPLILVWTRFHTLQNGATEEPRNAPICR